MENEKGGPRKKDTREKPSAKAIPPVDTKNGPLDHGKGQYQIVPTATETSVGEGAIVALTAKLANWTRWLAILTGVIAFATIALGVVGYFQLQELKNTDHNIAEQAKISAGQLEVMRAGQRAWISIGSIDIAGPLEFFEDRAQVGLKIVLRNTGNLPALRIDPVLHLYPGIHLTSFPSICKQDIASGTFGMALFPNESNERSSWNFYASTEAGDETTPIPKSGPFKLSIAGCVRYESAGDRKLHATNFAGFLSRRAVNPEHDVMFDRTKTRYEVEELFFHVMPDFSGDTK